MIAQLRGILSHTADTHAIIDVQGVGYLVHISGRTQGQLAAQDGAVTVLTEMIVHCEEAPKNRIKKFKKHKKQKTKQSLLRVFEKLKIKPVAGKRSRSISCCCLLLQRYPRTWHGKHGNSKKNYYL